MNQATLITEKLHPLTDQIANHSLYKKLTSMDSIRFFMQQHVFAVWDFMCLLKELHRALVCTASPWFPPKDSLSAHLIGSILAEEEGDLTEDGENYACHYDIYLQAMEKIGADTTVIRTLLYVLKQGRSINEALAGLPILASTKRFVLTTFHFFTMKTHELAAAFVYGREGITSPMFLGVVNQLLSHISPSEKEKLATLIYYLNRHVALDGQEHFPKALKMLDRLVADNAAKWEQVEAAAVTALTARIDFLSGIEEALMNEKTERVFAQNT